MDDGLRFFPDQNKSLVRNDVSQLVDKLKHVLKLCVHSLANVWFVFEILWLVLCVSVSLESLVVFVDK